MSEEEKKLNRRQLGLGTLSLSSALVPSVALFADAKFDNFITLWNQAQEKTLAKTKLSQIETQEILNSQIGRIKQLPHSIAMFDDENGVRCKTTYDVTPDTLAQHQDSNYNILHILFGISFLGSMAATPLMVTYGISQSSNLSRRAALLSAPLTIAGGAKMGGMIHKPSHEASIWDKVAAQTIATRSHAETSQDSVREVLALQRKNMLEIYLGRPVSEEELNQNKTNIDRTENAGKVAGVAVGALATAAGYVGVVDREKREATDNTELNR